jgi:hypothetical protein
MYTNRRGPRIAHLGVPSRSNGGATLDPATEHVLLRISPPGEQSQGGNIAFGPTTASSTSASATRRRAATLTRNGQRPALRRMLGKMLRIDVGTDPWGHVYTDAADESVLRITTAPGQSVQPGSRSHLPRDLRVGSSAILALGASIA